MNILHIVNFFNGGGSTKACLEHVINMPEHNHTFIGSDNGIDKNIFKSLGKTFSLPKDLNFNYPPILTKNIVDENNIDLINFYLPGGENPKFIESFPQKKICTILCGQKIGFDLNMFDHIGFASEYSSGLNLDVLNTSNTPTSLIRYGMGDKNQNFRQPDAKKPVVFGRVSAFCRSKRIIDTIKCAEKFPKNKFIVSGQIQDVHYFNEIYEYIQSKKIENIHLSYNISHSEKEKIYQEIDVLHYPTENEAFCFSILEGMQRWKAVISYNNSAIPELNHKNSLSLVDDELGLEEATDKYIKDRSFLVDMAIKNRKTYEEYYTGAIYTDNMRRLYDGFK